MSNRIYDDKAQAQLDARRSAPQGIAPGKQTLTSLLPDAGSPAGQAPGRRSAAAIAGAADAGVDLQAPGYSAGGNPKVAGASDGGQSADAASGGQQDLGVIAVRKLLENPEASAQSVADLIKRYPNFIFSILREAAAIRGQAFADDARRLDQRSSDALHRDGASAVAGSQRILPPNLPGSTSNRYDNPQNKAKAAEDEQRARDAQEHGETTPNPIGDMLAPKSSQLQPRSQSEQNADRITGKIIGDARSQIQHPDGGTQAPADSPLIIKKSYQP
jgi:hypothetical protein